MEIAEQALQYYQNAVSGVKSRAEVRQIRADAVKERYETRPINSDDIKELFEAIHGDIGGILKEITIGAVDVERALDSVVSDMPVSIESMKFRDALTATTEFVSYAISELLRVDAKLNILYQA